MVHLTIDETWTLQDLGRFVEPVEINDANGMFLGLFVPANLEHGKKLYADQATKINWVEIERREKSGEIGHTTDEVLERLQDLDGVNKP